MTSFTQAPPRTDGAQTAGWLPLVVVLAGTFVTFLDFFIVNVALPSIETDLAAGSATLSLVVAGYGLTFAVGMITGGRLGDLYGRRRMFLVGLGLFTLTSAACGLAPNAEVLVVARFLQGAAGALLTPQVLAILGTLYAGRRRGPAFAAYGFAMGIAGVLGQLIGGALIEADLAGSGWRAVFLINVPVGLLALPAARRVLPESRGPRARLDLAGVALVTVAATLLVLPLVEGREHGWPGWVWCCLAAAPVVAGGFVARQRRLAARGGAPLIDLGLFRHRAFAAGTCVALGFALIPSSFFFVLALHLQQGRGYGALFSGIVFAAVGAGYMLAMFLAGPLGDRLGHRVLAVGALGVAAGCALLVVTASAASALAMVPGLAVTGLGIGLVLVPLSSTVLAGIDPRHAGAAAGVLSMAQQTGGALGVAVIGVVFFGAGSAEGAFTASLRVLVGVAIAVAALTRLLRPSAAAGRTSRVGVPGAASDSAPTGRMTGAGSVAEQAGRVRGPVVGRLGALDRGDDRAR
ncbi:arabinose efflux permease family protein [Frankia sp. CpI1-P]|uniref:MFS transporter n=1 Tax=unclassified Frankia TaxID=2632575 RepID=UPI0006F65352|nr:MULTISPECIES: MFS transporter [unclassified Frankia]KQM04621.1 arabinose efflux permease family protein [Frankia sp. CpI1-P]